MATPAPLAATLDRHRRSALTAQRAAREAFKVRAAGPQTIGVVVASHQIAQARMGQAAVAAALAEQGVDAVADAPINPAAFTTPLTALAQMLAEVPTGADYEFTRLVTSLVQDAGRAAESVAVAVRPDVGWVRHLNLPSCSRCVALAGRVYRYSDGFLRHPGDDCVTTAVAEGDETRVADPVDLIRRGMVHGISKADTQAIANGADFNQVVNVRRKAAGLTEAGSVLARAGRPTPAGIYRIASTREEAVSLLQRFGYVLP